MCYEIILLVYLNYDLKNVDCANLDRKDIIIIVTKLCNPHLFVPWFYFEKLFE